MSYNGSGVAVINSAGQPVSANTLIEAAVFNAFTADVATMLSTVVCKDGQSTVTANLPMSGYRLTGLGAGSTNGHSLRYEQLFSTSAVTLLGAMNWVKGADIASAATINLTTATGNAVHVTGTTQIDAVTLGSGMWRMVIFDGILTLAHHATNNNLPGGANITTAANDRALYWSDGTTVYCAAYNKASGKSTVAPAVGDVTGLGTGVATALAVNIGSAGAPVLFNGALGTPSSGSLANCTGYPSQMIAATAQVSTSGTAITFPSIPSGVKRISVILSGVSTNGSNKLMVQIGDSGGLETSSYIGASSNTVSTTNFSSGFVCNENGAAGSEISGRVMLENVSGNIWVMSGITTVANAVPTTAAGTKTLSATLDRVSVTSVGSTDTFDAGTINILYE